MCCTLFKKSSNTTGNEGKLGAHTFQRAIQKHPKHPANQTEKDHSQKSKSLFPQIYTKPKKTNSDIENLNRMKGFCDPVQRSAYSYMLFLSH